MLKVVNVHKTFFPGSANETVALKGVDLTMEEGAFVVIVGSNGSGKSTLLNLIAGTIFPDSGMIHLNGSDVSRQPEHERAERIGRVFQDPFTGTAANLTVAENLALASRRGSARGLGFALSRKSRAEIRERVAELRFGLEQRLDNPMGSLSGGQRQALTLLMATWVRPALLLLDEHTAALDPRSAEVVLELTQNLIAEQRLTALMVTHSMHQAVHLGDRLIMMNQGSIIKDFRAGEKRRLRVQELLNVFDDVRRQDQLDETVAELLQQQYI